MKYLFFDIECCDGKHICEFGYVLTDEQFNVLDKECILINPEAPFQLEGRKDGRDLYLTHSEEEYRASPIFTAYYEKIKQLIEEKEQKIVGFSMNDDAKFLNTACKRKRYDLPPIEFEFFDMQKAYQKFFDKKPSLENAAKELEIPVPERLHESSEDALLTLEVFKQICKKKNISPNEVLQTCHSVNFGGNLNKEILYLSEHPNQFSKSKVKKIISRFVKSAKPQGDIIESEFTGKKVCFSALYEQEQPAECIILMQQIVNRGGNIDSKVSECDYYIKHDFDDENDKHSRYHYIAKVSQDQFTKVVSFDEFLAMLDLNETKLKELPVPQIVEPQRKQCSHIEESHASVSLGEILRQYGIAQ